MIQPSPMMRPSASPWRLGWPSPWRAGLAALLVAGACSGKAREGMGAGECSDGVDNDDNGVKDCEDVGCSGHPDCAGGDTGDTGDPGGDTGDTGSGVDPAVLDTFSWAAVPPGTFTMGSDPLSEEGAQEDEFQREITLTHTIDVSMFELTRAQFAVLRGYDPSPDDGCGITCPALNLTWHEAAAAADALSTAAGLASCYSCTGTRDETYCVTIGNPYTCPGFRLPTEAEWEYAALAGDPGVWSGSDDDPEAVGWILDNAAGVAHPVGELQPNEWSISDMTGNAWEWCHDYYDFYTEESVDPRGATSGTERVRRGGSHDSTAVVARSSNRDQALPEERAADTGARLVRVVDLR